MLLICCCKCFFEERRTFHEVLGTSRQSFSLSYKREALIKLKENEGNISKTCRELSDRKVSRQHLMGWRSNEAEIMQVTGQKRKRGEDRHSPYTEDGRKRRRLRTRKAHFPELEEELISWIRERREDGQCLNRKMVKNRALMLAKKLHLPAAFKASAGWMSKFIARNGLVKERSESELSEKVI